MPVSPLSLACTKVLLLSTSRIPEIDQFELPRHQHLGPSIATRPFLIPLFLTASRTSSRMRGEPRKFLTTPTTTAVGAFSTKANHRHESTIYTMRGGLASFGGSPATKLVGSDVLTVANCLSTIDTGSPNLQVTFLGNPPRDKLLVCVDESQPRQLIHNKSSLCFALFHSITSYQSTY